MCYLKSKYGTYILINIYLLLFKGVLEERAYWINYKCWAWRVGSIRPNLSPRITIKEIKFKKGTQNPKQNPSCWSVL